jgi:hypothetical protein
VRTKVTLVLIFLNVALFFFIFKFERNWRTEAASLEARRRVLGPEAANIRTLEVNRAGGVAFSLVRNRDDWSLTAPLNWPANPHAVSSILNELQLLEHDTSFRVADLAKTGQALADYGLDNPKVTVTFSSGDATGTGTRPPTTLRIGDVTKDGKRLYVLSPDGQRIHVVGRTLINTLSYTVDQLRTDTLFTIPVFEARSLGVLSASSDQDRGGTGAALRTRLHRDGARWIFDTPITARASKNAVDLVINDLNALQPRTFAPAGQATTTNVPEMRITLEGNNRLETLLLREPVGTTDGNPVGAANVEYRAELEGRNAAFTVAVPVRLLTALRNAQEVLREKRVIEDFEPNTVTSITLNAPLLSGPSLTLQRLDPPAGAGPDAAPQWQIITRSGAADAPKPIPADRGALQRLLERLTLLSAEKFKSDAPTSADLEEWGFNRAEREITLNFSNNRPPTVLRLGLDAQTNVYARVGTPTDPGSSIYSVNVDTRKEFPMETAAWRDRTLREPLPARARFSNLKITDLQGNQTVYETGFDANGEPTTAPRAPGSVNPFLAQLRNLRAKSILQGSFSDRVPLGGDERPWRYRVDATVVQPAGGGTEAPETTTLWFTDRLGGAQQYAGSRELDVMFEVEQAMLDARWALVARDPGPPPAGQAKG